jgi:hypothetical protein
VIRMRESSLYQKIFDLFNGDYHIFLEYRVQDCSRREIDVLCVQKQKDSPEILAIEAKINNWKIAFRQAFSRLFYVDRSYIAICREYVNKVDCEILQKHGIGLISVDGSAKVIVNAERSDRTMEWRKEMLLKDIMNRLK